MATTITATAAQWHWAAHVRTCTVDEQIVLLDLKSNRYMGIGGSSQQRLMATINGNASDRDAGHQAESADTVRPLVQQGLLVPATACSAPAVTLPPAARSLDVDEGVTSARTGAADIARFVCVAMAAKICLRWRSLHTIANKVSARRERRSAAPPVASLQAPVQAPSQALVSAIASYEKLRPLIFTARDQCLFDSLALIEWLAARGHYPHWVLGVKTHPFRAHAWVQQGDMVLNDHHEHVRRFQPILIA